MKVKFLPQNICVEVPIGRSLLEVARENKLPVSSSCNGMSTCAECRVYITEGETHVLPPSDKELSLIGKGYFIDNRRLCCQLLCFGDIVVDLSEQIERAKQSKGIKKQFLKQISESNEKTISSVGGVLVEQDEDINVVDYSEEKNISASPQAKKHTDARSKKKGVKMKNKHRQRRHYKHSSSYKNHKLKNK